MSSSSSRPPPPPPDDDPSSDRVRTNASQREQVLRMQSKILEQIQAERQAKQVQPQAEETKQEEEETKQEVVSPVEEEEIVVAGSKEDAAADAAAAPTTLPLVADDLVVSKTTIPTGNDQQQQQQQQQQEELRQEISIATKLTKVMIALACLLLLVVLALVIFAIVQTTQDGSDDASRAIPQLGPPTPPPTPAPTPFPTLAPTPAPTPSPFDFYSDCDTATEMGQLNYTSGSTLGLEPYQDLFNFSCGTGITTGGHWYRLTGTGRTLTATTCGPNTDFDTRLHVFEGGCGAGMTCVVGDDDDTCSFLGVASRVTWFAAGGQIYRIFVSGFGSSTGNYDLFLTGGASNPPTPAPSIAPSPWTAVDFVNDCNAALDIGVVLQSYNTTGSTLGLSSPYSDLSSYACGTGITTRGRWYRLRGTGRTLTATTCGSRTNYDTRLHVFQGDCGPELTCVVGDDDDACVFYSTASRVTWLADRNVLYTLFVSGYGSSTGAYDLIVNVTTPTPTFRPSAPTVPSPPPTFRPSPPTLRPSPLAPTFLDFTQDCEEALFVGVLGTLNTTGSTVGLSPYSDLWSYSCGTSITTGGRWYRMIGSGTTLTATTCGPVTDYDTRLHVFEGGCGPGLTCVVGDDDDSCSFYGTASRVSWFAVSGQTYHIFVSGYSSRTGDYSLIVEPSGTPTFPTPSPSIPTSWPSLPTSVPSPFAPTFQDFTVDCERAFFLGVPGNVNRTGSTVGLTPYSDLWSYSCGTGITTGGRWYRLIGSGTTLTATTCGPVTNYDTRLHVFTGPCGPRLTCVAGNDDYSCSFYGTASRVSWFATSGETYHIFVSGFSSRTGDYSLIVEPSNAPPTPSPSSYVPYSSPFAPFPSPYASAPYSSPFAPFPSEFAPTFLDFTADCAAAVFVGILGSLNTTNSTVGLSPYSDLPVYACGTSITTGGRWYRLIGSGTMLTATTCGPFTNYDTRLHVFTGGCGPGLTCVVGDDDDSCSFYGTASRVSWFAASGETYHIFVSGYSSRTGNYSLIVEPSGTPTFPTPFPSPPTSRPSLPTSFPSPFAPTSLDFVADCSEALYVGVLGSLNTTGSTVGLSPYSDLSSFSCGTSITTGGRWYRLDGSGTTLTATTCGPNTNYDTKLHVFTGRCGPDLTCVVGDDDDSCSFFGTASRVSWFAESGETYHIFVSGYSSRTGNYDLFVDPPAPPTTMGPTPPAIQPLPTNPPAPSLASSFPTLFPTQTPTPLPTTLILQEAAQLLANDVAEEDFFGSSVAIFNDTLVASSPGDRYGRGNNAGSVYVFVQTNSVWSQQAKLTPEDASANDEFGKAVAIFEDTIVVGAWQDDDNGSNSGSAYVFQRSGTTWSEQAKLTASDGSAGDAFGVSVAIDEDTIVVGASGSNDDTGSVYVFVQSGNTWNEQMQLSASDATAGDAFGTSVAMHAGTVAVGAPPAATVYVFSRSDVTWTEQAALTGRSVTPSDNFGISVSMSQDIIVAGAPNDSDDGSNSGSAYVFVRIGSIWLERAQLKARDAIAESFFGASVAVSADKIAVGATEAGSMAGSVYLFSQAGSKWSQRAKLIASDGTAGDELGAAVAMSTDLIIAGARLADTSGSSSGSVYTYDSVLPTPAPTASPSTPPPTPPPTVLTPQEVAILRASDAASGDQFGFAVAMSGNTIVVGAPENDDSGSDSGSAYVYTLVNGSWTEQSKLTAEDGTSFDHFGFSVGISGDTIVVGAYQDDDSGTSSGSAYVFVRNGSTWTLQAKLTANDATPGDEFGWSVAIFEDTIVVGAFRDDDGGSDSGSAYVFQRLGTSWSQQAKLIASDAATDDSLGRAVAIFADTVVVGALNPSSSGSGSAYVFGRTGTTWTQQAKLTSEDPWSGDVFGRSVSVYGDLIAVGAQWDTGQGYRSGSVYVFARQGATWAQEAKLFPNDGEPDEWFGYSVAITPTTLAVGAVYDDDIGFRSGSAYLFARMGTSWSQQYQLLASDGASYDIFGESVAVSDGRVVVGAYGTDYSGSGSGSAYVFALPTAQAPTTLPSSPTSPTPPTALLPQEVSILLASNGAARDWFGLSVAISGDTIVVGAPNTVGSGSAYVFIGTDLEWTQEAILKASDGTSSDSFGTSVAISLDTIVVGAPGTSDAGSNSGSAYVFRRSGNTWSQEAKLVASDAAAGDLFGNSAAVSADTVVIGAPEGDGLGRVDSGSAYVFSRVSGTSWSQQAKLTANDASSLDQFGRSVAIFEQTVVVGALSASTTSNPSSGSAYVFVRSGAAWSQQAKLTSTSSEDAFGRSVGIYGGLVVVGAQWDNDLGVRSGSVHVFVREGAIWSREARLLASDGSADDWFGFSVGVYEDTIVVGAFWDDDTGGNSGSAYLFARNGSSWSEQAKLTASDGSSSDWFGNAVAIDDNRIVVGAYRNDVSGSDSGSAYVFAWPTVGTSTIQSPAPSPSLPISTAPPSLSAPPSLLTLQEVAVLRSNDAAAYDLFGASAASSGDTVVVGAPYDDERGVDSGSVYVYIRTSSGWAQQAKLTASDGDSLDYFGSSVAISMNILVVGAFGGSDAGIYTGSAYVFMRSGNTWSLQTKLLAADAAAGDRFGWSVAIFGDTIVVGALNEDASGIDSGSVYIFDRFGSSWVQQAKLTASDGAAADGFGRSVAMFEDTVVVGAVDSSGTRSGSAYVFVRAGTTWSQEAKLISSNPGIADIFGGSVAIFGDLIVVGAQWDDELGYRGGSAYVFTRNGEIWTEEVKLLPLDGGSNEWFGNSVAVINDMIVVGSPYDGDTVLRAGSAYIFNQTDASWMLQAKLLASDGASDDTFGGSLAVGNGRVVVGVIGDDQFGMSETGSAYIFEF